MTNPVTMKTTLENDGVKYDGYFVWCPGCDYQHLFNIKNAETQADAPLPFWEFNGNLERPTFSPSFKMQHGKGEVCHSYLTEGMWQFLDDCTHDFAGQTISMVPLPDWLVAPAETFEDDDVQ